MTVPKSHPRYESLRIREMLSAGFLSGAVALEGVMAHGRGEALDYILGEETPTTSKAAARAAAATLLLSSYPVISVNGNVAALCSREIVNLSCVSSSKIEVNLFYDSMQRRRIIIGMLRRAGAREVLGLEKTSVIEGFESARRMTSYDGIYKADTVIVPLEDGDRTQSLVDMGKKVITIDLNPLSRTARTASITIVDNIVRALPLLASYCREMKSYDTKQLEEIVEFDNMINLKECVQHIKEGLKDSYA
ncbi:MAG: phosphopantothenate/pantothenate synthetase [Cenarchaeum sp. SB0665_bin_23]|nr:phosphopantothenate/pantothenate synthetase [Cenarchaeum sp. SB0667_bin_13]MXY37827.1 phosphopantothenate/pantothenate synthetase [Cenarchaeum sp. SB0664_bin_35]MXY61362.1 phosphopantothenate/pantothenate synthetase [Cenarchaeum sp. SB0665_bin_23]MXZ93300.1 phosphopantothenate/pantothenate synthetase [Cenarchaeum sp. SB0666_bin_15]MYB47172.1 phosphopantothenate/pantothenate synthetase [Cenarchaeum sp. SB0662_bin_33]MYC78953.1 phosphopantothenate/pantothenate synthetase [Cenarchaeum sp. SB06